MSLNADGRLAVSASEDKTLKVWDIESGCELRTLRGHSEAVTAVSLNADGRLAVSASEDKTLKVWDVESGCELRTLQGHSNAVRGVALTADGNRAVSAAFYDTTLKVWDVESGRELMTIVAHEVWRVAWSSDGRILLSGGGDGIIQVCAMEIDLLMSLARSRVTRNLTPEESEKYLHREKVPKLPGSDEPLKAWYEGRY